MYETLLAANNLPFTIALVVAAMIGIIETISLVFGGIFNSIDMILPDKDFGIVGDFSVSDYLCIGRIPLLMWLIIFLTSCGLGGTIIQHIFALNLWLIGPLMILVAVFPTRYISIFMHKIMPQDETTAINVADLVGMSAVIVIGTATPGNPTQAKVIDLHRNI